MNARALLIVALLAAPSASLGCEASSRASAPVEPVAAREPQTAPASGSLTLLATDAFVPFADLAAATVRVERIDALVGEQTVTIHDGDAIELDLIDLRNGVTAVLADARLPAGELRELRLFFEDAALRLRNGNVYDTARGNLRLTTRAAAGLTVRLDPPVAIGPGGAARVLVDFDLTRTFQPIPACDPQDAAIYVLAPAIRTADLGRTGAVRGVVTEADGGAAVPNATVLLLPAGERDLARAVTTTATASDGTYALIGIAPDTYDVVARFEHEQVRSDGNRVTAGATTVVSSRLR